MHNFFDKLRQLSYINKGSLLITWTSIAIYPKKISYNKRQHEIETEEN
jgi:hypothetical protein